MQYSVDAWSECALKHIGNTVHVHKVAQSFTYNSSHDTFFHHLQQKKPEKLHTLKSDLSRANWSTLKCTHWEDRKDCICPKTRKWHIQYWKELNQELIATVGMDRWVGGWLRTKRVEKTFIFKFNHTHETAITANFNIFKYLKSTGTYIQDTCGNWNTFTELALYSYYCCHPIISCHTRSLTMSPVSLFHSCCVL